MSDTPLLTQSDLPDLISRYLQGASIQELAADARVNRRTIYRWMHNEQTADYEPLITQAMVARMADADHDLSTATDMCHIARAREEAKYARWDLERRRPSLFGLKQELKTDSTITVVIQRLTEEPRTIEGVTSDAQTED